MEKDYNRVREGGRIYLKLRLDEIVRQSDLKDNNIRRDVTHTRGTHTRGTHTHTHPHIQIHTHARTHTIVKTIGKIFEKKINPTQL